MKTKSAFSMSHAAALAALPPAHRAFYDRITACIPADRIFLGPFHNLALGDDASFYRLVPKIVVKAATEAEVARLLRAASAERVAVTFRTAGTSLSGQALTDSVLIYLAGHWRGARVHPGADFVSLEPGVIGAEANFQLAPYGRKIGPDPASINACMAADLEQRIGKELPGPFGMGTHPFAAGEKGGLGPGGAQRIDHGPVIARRLVSQLAQVEGQGHALDPARVHPADGALEPFGQGRHARRQTATPNVS